MAFILAATVKGNMAASRGGLHAGDGLLLSGGIVARMCHEAREGGGTSMTKLNG